MSIENELKIFWPWWADNLICIKTHFHARVLCPPFPLNKYSAEILVCLHFAFATMSFRIFIALSMLCINWKWHKTDTEESTTTRTKQWNIQLEKNFRIVVVHPTTWIESWWYDQTWYYNIPHFHLSACIICAWQVVYWFNHTTLERAGALQVVSLSNRMIYQKPSSPATINLFSLEKILWCVWSCLSWAN